MRYLHPINAHEQFVAQGIYQHYDNDMLTGTLQSWTIHALEGGARLIRIDDDERNSNQGVRQSRLTEILENPQGRIERLTEHHHIMGDALPYKELRLDYVFLNDYVQMTRTVDRKAHEYSELAMPSQYWVTLPYVVCLGRQVALPQAFSPEFPAFSLIRQGNSPKIGEMQEHPKALIHEEEETLMMGQKTVSTVRYRSSEGFLLWLNAHYHPVKVLFANGTRYQLTNYAHR